MTSQTSLDTKELIDSMGRVRDWVLPSGVMRELLSRGSEIVPVLHQLLSESLNSKEHGLEPLRTDSFFCFHLLGVVSQSDSDVIPWRTFIGQLLRNDYDLINHCIGEISASFFRAVIASLVGQDDPREFCQWIDSLIQDDQVNDDGKFQAVDSLFNLVGDGVLEDAEAVRWTTKWLEQRKDHQYDNFISMVAENLVKIGGKDLKELIRACFHRDQIDDTYIDIEYLDKMPDDRQVDQLRERAEDDRQQLRDPIGYLEQWHGFAWTADTLDPQSGPYQRIAEPPNRLRSRAIEQWLVDIDRSSYETYPSLAIKDAREFVEHTIEQLTDRVERGIQWARQGESFSTNGPYLSAMFLARNCNNRLVMMTDADQFFRIIDLNLGQRSDWFGDSIEMNLTEALTHVLSGKTQPISLRINDSSREDIDRATLVSFFPISVYHGYLPPDRCLEILRDHWQSLLRENSLEDSECQLALNAVYDAFCLLSIADDAPIMRQAEEAGVENFFLYPESAKDCQSDPSAARNLLKLYISRLNKLEDMIESDGKFDPAAMKPPPVWAERKRQYLISPTTSQATIRSNQQKVGRNAPCTCGSGKKFKKCCGKR